MAFAVENYDAWVLSPYCFCKDRPWLSIDGLNYLDIDEGGGGIVAIPGLSVDETALLAALLTALAIFLFLLLLLLCLLCPFGLCFGKKGLCCSKASKAKKSEKTALKAPSVTSSNSVNLTAVDMKIPRAWMDNYAGFSDSELDRKGKSGNMAGWDDADSGRWWTFGNKYGYKNSGFQGDDFRSGGWFSTSDLDSIYGDRSIRGRKGWDGTSRGKGEMIAMDEYYRGTVKRRDTGDSNSSLRYKSNSYSSIIEKLMTPHATTDLCTHGNGKALSAHGNDYHGYGASYGNDGRAVASMTLTKQEMTKSVDVPLTMMKSGNGANTMNEVAEISLSDSRGGAGQLTQATPTLCYNNSVYGTGAPPYAESVATTTTVALTDNANAMRERDMRSNLNPPDHGVVTEILSKSAYTRRVVEETETISSN